MTIADGRNIIPSPAALPDVLVQPDRDAISRPEAGVLADREARSLITTSFTLTREESAAIDAVTGSPHTAYESRGDFIRHAVWELLNAWAQSGFPSNYVSDIVAHVRAMRAAAFRLRIRQEFEEILQTYEVSLSAGVEAGDWGLVLDTLTTIQGFVDRTTDNFWREHLRRTVARSPVAQRAIGALYEAARTKTKLMADARYWQEWLESLQV